MFVNGVVASFSVPVVVRKWHSLEAFPSNLKFSHSFCLRRDTARVSELTVYLAFTDLLTVCLFVFWHFSTCVAVRKVIVNVLCFWWGCYGNQSSMCWSDPVALFEWTMGQGVCSRGCLGHLSLWVWSKCADVTVVKQCLAGWCLSFWGILISITHFEKTPNTLTKADNESFLSSYRSKWIIDLLGMCWELRRERKGIPLSLPTFSCWYVKRDQGVVFTFIVFHVCLMHICVHVCMYVSTIYLSVITVCPSIIHPYICACLVKFVSDSQAQLISTASWVDRTYRHVLFLFCISPREHF